MKDKKLENLIKELKHAQKTHEKKAADLKLSKNEKLSHKRVVTQKEIIIKALEREIPVKKTYFGVVERWRDNHLRAMEYLAHYFQKSNLSKKKTEELKEVERGGSLNWHLKWIRNYWWVGYYLDKLQKQQRNYRKSR